MEKIVALFVHERGPYMKDDRVDAWGITRDARLYEGDLPVVAHPPCQLWGNFAKINFLRWGGEHNRPGNDGGCFSSALRSVRRCGGVLEHPANSMAWKYYGLINPSGAGWLYCGNDEYVCEVWQSAYGHRARKRTWLFYKGDKPKEMNWIRRPGSHQIGFRDQRGKKRNKPTLSGAAASETPLAFMNALIDLAKNSNLRRENGK